MRTCGRKKGKIKKKKLNIFHTKKILQLYNCSSFININVKFVNFLG